MVSRLIMLAFLLTVSPVLAQSVPNDVLMGVIVHTSFAHDRGDMVDCVEYDGVKYQPEEAANAIIPKIGWNNQSKREDIAWAWVTRVGLVGSTLLKQKPEEFTRAEQEFETPKVHLFEDGSVEVVLWYRHPVGMLPGHHYSKRNYKFSSEGRLTVESLADVRIP